MVIPMDEIQVEGLQLRVIGSRPALGLSNGCQIVSQSLSTGIRSSQCSNLLRIEPNGSRVIAIQGTRRALESFDVGWDDITVDLDPISTTAIEEYRGRTRPEMA